MTRQEASKYLRDRLDSQSLEDWHIRLSAETYRPFLGMCSYKDKTIILNAHHIDQHPDEEIHNTINHEVAHALTPNCGHNEIWQAKARELGCDNVSPCASYNLSPEAIDAIRSGAQLEITFETEVIRKPKFTISRLQDKCPTCGKVAKEKSRVEVNTSGGNKVIVTLECNHILFKDASSTSPFEKVTFDGNPSCHHKWGEGKERTTCLSCGAHRLYEFQVLGCKAIERANGKFGVFDEMGLGKTIQAAIYLRFHESDAWPFLWVTKSGIKYQHAKELIRLIGMKAFPQILKISKETLIPGMNVLCS